MCFGGGGCRLCFVCRGISAILFVVVLFVFRGLLFALWCVRWVIDRFLGVAGIVSGRLGGDSVRGVQSRKVF